MRRRAPYLLVLVAACDGDGPAGPSGTVTETLTLTGTTRAFAAGACQGDNHSFTAAEGAISVTLTRTTPAESLTVQICPLMAAGSDACTFSRQRIDVGQTLRAARRGGAEQSLSLLPLTCGTNAPPSPEPISYTAMLTFQREQ